MANIKFDSYNSWLKTNQSFLNINEIETAIGCPKTTIQKFLQNKRLIPSKWHKPLKLFIDDFRKL